MSTEQMEQDELHEAAQVDLQAGTEAAGTEAAGTDAADTEMEQLRGERDQLLDRIARLQAEFDNARKREAKERARTPAIMPFSPRLSPFSA
jgi:molecular chaperone GrpE